MPLLPSHVPVFPLSSDPQNPQVLQPWGLVGPQVSRPLIYFTYWHLEWNFFRVKVLQKKDRVFKPANNWPWSRVKTLDQDKGLDKGLDFGVT